MAVRLPSSVLYLVLIVLTIYVPRAAPSASQVTGGAEPQKREVATDVQDLQSVVISLSRAEHRYGLSYSLKITGDGIVEYHGRGYYVTGHHRCLISNEEVRELLEAFQDADFYSLEDESMLVFDRQIIEISLTIGGQTKTVDDRLREFAEFQRLNQLAARIDQLSHADQWLTGNAETVPGLLADRENLNVPDDQGKTTLMWSCQRGDAAVVREFLSVGANLQAKDRYGRTALMYAAARGLPEIMEVVLQAGADPKEPDGNGDTPLMHAAGINDGWDSEYFLRSRPTYLLFPWEFLLEPSNPNGKVVRMLLQASADPNAGDSEGATALMYAAESFRAGTDVLRVLVDGGAHLNQKDNEGRAALMRAADQYQVDSVRFLVAAKANVNLRDSKGRTVLGRLHPPRDKLFRRSPVDNQSYNQIRVLLKQAGSVR